MVTWRTFFFWSVIIGGICALVMAQNATAATGVHTIRHERTDTAAKLGSRHHQVIHFQSPADGSSEKWVEMTLAGRTTGFDPDADYEHQGQGHIDENMHLLRAVRLYRSLTRKTVVLFTKKMPSMSDVTSPSSNRLIISRPRAGQKLHDSMPTVPRKPRHEKKASRQMVMAR